MIRNLFIFLATFVAGAIIALVIRASTFEKAERSETSSPATAQSTAPAAAAQAPESSHAGHTGSESMAAAKTAPASHDPHAQPSVAAAAQNAAQPVNTVCAICGMDVDPALPTVQYEGKTIGFGCRMCPPKFKADPDKYGPLYLKNEVIQR